MEGIFTPKGIKGFQPGRKRTGGKEKGEPKKAHLTTAFRDRLKFYGFNFDRQFALCLKKMCLGKPAPQYAELRALLPYAYPKLKEIEPPEPVIPSVAVAPMTDAELLEALNPHEPKEITTESSGQSTDIASAMAAGDVDLQTETDPEGTVSGMAGEQTSE